MYRQSWERGNILNQVFESGNFEEHLHTLQKRAQQNLRLLERNTDIRRGVYPFFAGVRPLPPCSRYNDTAPTI